VGPECKGLWADTYYCVGIPGTPTVPITSSTAKATPTGAPKPSPTQDGLISTCEKFYFAGKQGYDTNLAMEQLLTPWSLVKDDTCAKIVKKFGTFTVKDFIAWNPAVGDDCSGLWADTL
jgi:hypothetical protein